MAEDGLIGGRFEVETGHPLPGMGGGLPAFAVADRLEGRGGGLMAVQARRGMPPRDTALAQLMQAPLHGVTMPLAHGAARDASGAPAWFVICQLPPGPPLLASGLAEFPPWGERELLDCVLRPACRALEALQAQNLTHRAIRPDNLFRAGPGEPVELGCAWASPPGALQPAVLEPPYAGMCHPAGRGRGVPADDIYALGAVLLVLASGRLPLAGLAAQEVVRCKLEQGSFAALAGEARLPPVIADLARGMLAEDPDHRPTPAMLADPAGARSRRVAARPPRRAQRPLEIGGVPVWTARTLAHAIAADPAAGIRALRGGAVDRWIRRSLGDGMLAARLDETLRLRGPGAEADPAMASPREDAALAMRAVASLDPLAPLCWDGVAFWPDAAGPMLTAEAAATGTGAGTAGPGGRAPAAVVTDVILSEGVAQWAACRPDRADPAALRREGLLQRALLRSRAWGNGIERLRYALNPLLPCASPLLRGMLVVHLPDLLPALERVAARAGDGAENGGTQAPREGAPREGAMAEGVPADREIAAFIAARSDTRMEPELAPLGEARLPELAALAALRLYGGLQARLRLKPLPALAAWLAGAAGPALASFHSRTRRAEREAALAELARSGRLAALLAVLDDPGGREEDRAGHEAALARAAAIDAELAALRDGRAGRDAAARRIGHDLVAAGGVMALMLAVLFGVLV